MSAPEIQRDLGRLEAEVAALKVDVAAMGGDVKTLLALFNQGKGGWKVIVGASAFGAALMAALLKILPMIPWGR